MKIRYTVWIILAVAVVSLSAATYVADEQIVVNSTAVGFTSALITPNVPSIRRRIHLHPDHRTTRHKLA